MSTLFILFWLIGVCLGLEVHQSPSDLIAQPDDKVQIFCNHDKTDYRVMLWYQHSPGDTAMKLIGYLYNKEVKMEESYKRGFNISGDLSGTTAKNGSLIFKLLAQEHSAVYYCAARGQGGAAEAFFGGGTKLTVLGRTITPPTVTVFKPSSKECRNLKDEKERKKTLLCVARDFYPDHVSMFWQVNAKNVTKGVATDPAAWLDNGTYFITSRLRVLAEVWTTPGTNFSCFVSFFNGNKTIKTNETVFAVEADGSVKTRVTYLRSTQSFKLSYTVLIIKSSIYGAFVAFLVWKLQGSTGKQKY